jgi:hypothetical protein
LQAAAEDIVIGIGQDNIGGAEAAIEVHVELHSDPLWSTFLGDLSGMGVVEVDETRDVFAGLGVSTLWDLPRRWFVEASAAVGYYEAGPHGADLGGHLQFRTLIGLGYRIRDRARLSIAIDHLSNAGLDEINPGRNAVVVRYATEF